MEKKSLYSLAFTIGVLLFVCGFTGNFQFFEGNGIAYAAVVEPHCTNGDCSDYALWCVSKGRIPMCLNAYTDHEVTVCMGAKAMPELWNNVPNTCIGTCYHAHQEPMCNFALVN